MERITALLINKYGAREEVYTENILKPHITKKTELLVRVKATAINPSDFLFIGDKHFLKAESFPSRVGFEGAGIVEEAGEESGFKVGQHIHFVSRGSWSEYVVVNTTDPHPVMFVPVPDSLSFEEAAQLTINPLSSVALLQILDPKEGEHLIINAASSALARILIQLAKAKGVKTICIVRRDGHFESLKSLGADFVINSETEDITSRVNQIIPGGAKYGLDAVGGKEGTQMIQKLIAENGVYINYGVLGGLSLELDILNFDFKSLTIKGFYQYNWIAKRGAEVKKDYEELIQMILDKKIKLSLKTFDGKTQAAQALEHAQTPGKSEKTILLF